MDNDADTPQSGPEVPEREASGEPQPGATIDRRQFLNSTWKVLGVALVAEAAWTSYDILKPGVATGFGGTVDAGPVSDFLQEGSVTYFLEGRFYITQYQGGLRALYQKCPHLGCRVPFCESSGQFECPCHGSVYNEIGEYIKGPAPRGMDRFPISIQNGHVMVDTSAFVEGPARGVLDGPSRPTGPSCLGAAPAAPPAPGSSSSTSAPSSTAAEAAAGPSPDDGAGS
jgi:cytochrome b6-f complex iron-sulfur subunit